MDNQSKNTLFSSPSSFDEFLYLLNEIKTKELGEKAVLYNQSDMKYFSYPINRKYHHFQIPKKNGKLRDIYAPCASLKYLQHFIDLLLKSMYTPSKYAMGFVENKSIVTNAQNHVGKKYVYNIDIENFFPSISRKRVFLQLQLPPFNFTPQLSTFISNVCCTSIVVLNNHGEEKTHYALPQGAPTSPLLSNAICDILDYNLHKLALKYNLDYSRYADDITFSGNTDVFYSGATFIKHLKKIIKEQGFSINETKTRLQRRGEKQIVTGLNVTNKVNVSKHFCRSLRQILYIWSKYGEKDAQKRYVEYHRKHNPLVLGKDIPKVRDVIKGKIEFLKMVKGEDDVVYHEFLNLFRKLSNENNQRSSKLEFKNKMSFEEYEKLHGEIFFSTNVKSRYAYYISKENKKVFRRR